VVAKLCSYDITALLEGIMVVNQPLLMVEGTLPLIVDSECYLKTQNYFCIYRLRIGWSQDRLLFSNTSHVSLEIIIPLNLKNNKLV